MFCTKCGGEIQPHAHYCSGCGSGVEVLEHTETISTTASIAQPTKAAIAHGEAWLIVCAIEVVAMLLGIIFYGALLYSSCSATGSVTLPVVGVELHCQQSAEDVARQENAEFLKTLVGVHANTSLPASPYDSIACVGTDYQLYVVLIPYDKSAQGKTSLAFYQKDILAFLREIEFPAYLIQGRFIVIVSPTYKGGTVVLHGMSYEVSGSGNEHAGVYEDGTMFLYGSALGDRLHAAVAHELGHLVGNTFSTGDWVEWARLRGDPNARQTLGTTWEQSVEEDFAEEFKRYVGGYKGDPDIWGN
jgi:uncharacterized OB-fold protein